MQFRKKPIVIEAIQFDKKDPAPMLQFVSACTQGEPTSKFIKRSPDDQWFVRTLEGNMLISDKDWLIQGVNGEFYPCKPDIFEKSYSPASEKETPNLPAAVDKLCNELAKDSSYYETWQANIAVAFQDEAVDVPELRGYRQEIHTTSNKAAKRFLNNLIHITKAATILLIFISLASCSTYREYRSQKMLAKIERKTVRLTSWALTHPNNKKALARKWKRLNLKIVKYNNLPE